MKVMVVGAGKLGYKLAEFMVMDDMDVTVIDHLRNSRFCQ